MSAIGDLPSQQSLTGGGDMLPDQVREELDRLLSDSRFSANDNRRRMLRYVVEETLAGRANRLKGTVLAQEVFGRGAEFDPQTDPVVRIEARKLRRDLEVYYAAHGASAAVRFCIPKGAYAATFEVPQEPLPEPALRPSGAVEQDIVETDEAILQAPTEAVVAGDDGVAPSAPPHGPSPTVPRQGPRGLGERLGLGAWPKRRPNVVRAVLLGLVALGLIVHVWWPDGSASTDGNAVPGSVREISLMVLPFETIGESAQTQVLAEGLRHELVVDLMRFPGLRLFASLPPESGALQSATMAEAHEQGIAYLLSGSVLVGAQQAKLVVHLVDAATGQLRWSRNYERPLEGEDLVGAQIALAAEVAAAIGQPYGVVFDDLRRQGQLGGQALSAEYLCVLQGHDYRRSFEKAKFDQVLPCLEAAVASAPGDAEAWAMLGWLRLDGARFEYLEGARADLYAQAQAAVSQALRLAPDNAMALKAASSVYHFTGNLDRAERLARRAVERNPNDPDALAELAWRLSARGDFDAAMGLLDQAVMLSGTPPRWYYYLIAIGHFYMGDFGAMVDAAERALIEDVGVGDALLAIGHAELGEWPEARAALERRRPIHRWRATPMAIASGPGLAMRYVGN